MSEPCAVNTFAVRAGKPQGSLQNAGCSLLQQTERDGIEWIRAHRPCSVTALRVDEDLGDLCAVLDAVGGEAELHVLVPGPRGELDGDRVAGGRAPGVG